MKLDEARCMRLRASDPLLCKLVLRGADLPAGGLDSLTALLGGNDSVVELALGPWTASRVDAEAITALMTTLRTTSVERLVLRDVDALATPAAADTLAALVASGRGPSTVVIIDSAPERPLVTACDAPLRAVGSPGLRRRTIGDTERLEVGRDGGLSSAQVVLPRLRARLVVGVNDSQAPDSLRARWADGGLWTLLTEAHRMAMLEAYRTAPLSLLALYDALAGRREEKAEVLDHWTFAGQGEARRLVYGLSRAPHASGSGDVSVEPPVSMTPLAPDGRYRDFYPWLLARFDQLRGLPPLPQGEGWRDRTPGRSVTLGAPGVPYSTLSFDVARDCLRIDHTPSPHIAHGRAAAARCWRRADEVASVSARMLAAAWHLYQVMPVVRGNASIVEDLLAVLSRAHESPVVYPVAADRPPLDLLAIFSADAASFSQAVRAAQDASGRSSGL